MARWGEHALHDAIVITARAAFMQLPVQGYGFIPLSRESAAKHGKEHVEYGYFNVYAAIREGK